MADDMTSVADGAPDAPRRRDDGIAASRNPAATPAGVELNPVETALWQAASMPLAPFTPGDHGKRVDALITTPEWMALSKAVIKQGVDVPLFVRTAIRQHLAWLKAYGSPIDAAKADSAQSSSGI